MDETLFRRLRQNDHTFTTLDLRANNIDAQGAEVLATVLQHNKTLTSLNLDGNNVGAQGAEALAYCLET
jgi:Ran GTPase-activating protein (RanGAP) involved in mRNA processing and transport